MRDDTEELILGTMKARDGAFAEFLVVSIGLAAERHPDLLRTALEKVFDLAAMDESQRQMALVLSRTQALATELQQRVNQLNLEIDELVQSLDQLRYVEETYHGDRS